ncbi:dermonecrotic toxin domain-containing protein [Pseudomonas sp. IT-P176]|uniref:dermonecrotic toxin domain-containing protein n=1 Tax=Pseudomonas sp. IT-P176 TaxID=3026444 RepID=UPI0039E1122F
MTGTRATPEDVSDTLAQAVYEEFKGRPIVVTAALKQFGAALNNRYPGLNIDVLTTSLNSPNWVRTSRAALEGEGDSGHLVEHDDPWIDGYTTTPLFEVMIHAITASAQLTFTREHYLSDGDDRRIAVEMREVEDLLRRLPKVMLAALQQALTDYWNEPAVDGTSRWQWLGDVLRSALLVSMGPSGSGAFLDAGQVDTVLQVIRCPIKEDRVARYGPDCTQVFLIDYHARTGRTHKAHLAFDLVAVRTVSTRDIVMGFSTSGVIETYDTWQAFADSEGDKWGRRQELSVLELQPYESFGDVFVTQAQALLNNQLESLSFFGVFEGQDLKVLEERYASLTDLAPHLLKQNPGAYEQVLYSEVGSQLPDWIELATPAETQEYSRYMFRLAALQLASKGQEYSHGIRTAEQFAREVLQDGMAAYGEAVDPDQVDITQYRNEDGLLVIVGPGTGRFTSETLSLTHRALNNLAGVPFLVSEFKRKDGSAAPAWMTLDTVRELIRDADIGKNYPDEVKRLLLDDPVQRAEREKLFSDQLRIQLPMLALENRIRKRSGFTDAGYRCVAAIMESDPQARRVSGQVMLARTLAFKTDVSNHTHVVADMFVFGPADVTAGPHVLYRPLYPEPLIEFASLDALMAEIVSNNPRTAMSALPDGKSNPSLQQSILDWLAPDARKIYDNGGFLEPHPVGIIFETQLWPSAPARFDLQQLDDKVLAHLYEANANVLAQLADEQTLSNAEYRWNTLKEMGLIIFNSVLNTVLPFVSGPAAAVGWLLVVETAVLEALESLASDDSAPAKDFTYNLLINLAVALLIQRLSPGAGTAVKPFEHHAIVSRPGALEVSAVIKPPIGPGAASAISDSVLDFSTPVSGDSRRLLERFLSTEQVGRGREVTAPAPQGIVVVGGRWYAKVPARLRGYGWANVEPAEGGNVVILDHLGRPIKGLELKNNGQDLWEVAPEFRVRGGGPGMSRYLSDVFADSQLRARRADYALKVKRLKDRLPELDASIKQAQEIGQAAQEKVLQLAEEIAHKTTAIEASSDAERSRLLEERVALRKKLHAADIEYKKKVRTYIDGHLGRIKLCEEIDGLLAKDKDYQRDAILENLQGIVSGYGVVDENLIRMSAVWEESGVSIRTLFPLAFELRTAVTDVPYSVLLEARKRIVNGFAERIRISTQLEKTMTELEVLDRSVRKGYLQRTGYLSENTQRLKDILDKRVSNTDWLIVHEMVCLRGALVGDPALEPSLAEVAGLEGLGKAKLSAVTDSVLRLSTTQGFEPRQRVELLQAAIYVYNDAELMAANLRKIGDRQSYVAQFFLEKFLDALRRARAIAETELSESISEDLQEEPAEQEGTLPAEERVKKTRRRIKRPNERLIQTADGYRVGDVREQSSDETGETVVVQDAATDKQIIFYKDEGQDLYRQREEEPEVPVAAPPKPALALQSLLDKGRKLVEGITPLIANYKKDVSRYREPASVEDRFLSQAQKLSELATQIQHGMQGVTGADRGRAVKIYQDLNSAREQLIREGKKLRVEITKQLPPNAGSFEYLLGEREVHVENPSWTDKSTANQTSYLLEYDIVDSASRIGRKVLWYAHFHCTAKSVLTLTEAHLKLARLRFVTVKDQVQHPELNAGKVVYPGGMKAAFAKKYFFDAVPPMA